MKSIAVIPNYIKKETLSFANELSGILAKKGHTVSIIGEKDEISKDTKLAIVLGGDGTMLRACKRLYGIDCDVFGVNFGHIGYLTQCNPENAIDSISKILDGDYTTENRLMIEGELIRNDKQIGNFVALNEASLYRASLMKALGAKVFVNGEYTQTVYGDGIIVSTPTGSTSYNLSCGGPVIAPTSNNIVLTQISPKFFPRSSIVVAGDDKIAIQVEIDMLSGNESVSLEVDADIKFEVLSGDIIKIKKAPLCAKIVKVGDKSFYQIFSEKLAKINYEKR